MRSEPVNMALDGELHIFSHCVHECLALAASTDFSRAWSNCKQEKVRTFAITYSFTAQSSPSCPKTLWYFLVLLELLCGRHLLCPWRGSVTPCLKTKQRRELRDLVLSVMVSIWCDGLQEVEQGDEYIIIRSHYCPTAWRHRGSIGRTKI